MHRWQLEFDSYKPEEQGTREALCTLGNGYFATRGAFEESDANEIHYPGTYIAGGYNRLKTELEGHIIENEDLVNFPNWLILRFRIGEGSWFSLDDVKILRFKQTLNLKEGVLGRSIQFIDEQGRQTSLEISRFVSMDHPHLAAIKMVIYPENWEGEMTIQSALNGRVKNEGVKRYNALNNVHLEPIETTAFDNEGIYLQVKTNQSHLHIALAARTSIFQNKKRLRSIDSALLEESGYIAKFYTVKAEKNLPIEVEKIVALYTSKDHAISEPGLEAYTLITEVSSFANLLKKHIIAWKHLWRRFDIQITFKMNNGDFSKLLRLQIFHILQTTSKHSIELDVGVPPRGWHGESYRGHILWDELFVFSTLNLQLPELTRALLMYRYRRLFSAKEAARKLKLKGAMYPWQSGSDGREESQNIHLNPLSKRWVPDNSSLQRHVNLAIAYNVWQHFEATGDLEFLSFYGAEMLFEIARFFASLATYSEEKKRYEILGVMGPDEYHDAYPNASQPGINNNAYTNVMASWLFSTALRTYELLPEHRRHEVTETVHLNPKELRKWEEIGSNLYIPFSDSVISQFEGYENLKELDWEKYKKKYGNIERLDRILEAEGDSVNNYKASKQGDVLMLFFLLSAEQLGTIFERLGYELEPDTIQKTIEYYLDRTSDGSTLSRLVHSWVVSRSNREKSWNLFSELLHSDFNDIQGGTTKEGIHLGAMAGTVDLLQRCYTGIEYKDDILRFNPCLPKEIERLETVIRYRGHALLLILTKKCLHIKSERASAMPIQIAFKDGLYSLKEQEEKVFDLL